MIRLAVLAILSMLAACSGLHSDNPPTQIYILRAHRLVGNAETSGAALTRSAEPLHEGAAPTLQLPRPAADPGLGTELITLVRSDHRLDYYAGSRWAATLPEMVQTLATDTLRASGAWRAVHEAPSAFASDYVLQINIRRFEADYTDGGAAPRVHVVLDCLLSRRLGRELIASFVAEGDADAGENRLSSVVGAFEKAANAALTTMADRSAAAVRAAPAVAGTP